MAPLLTLASPARLHLRILPWFRKHRRDLPWRASRDPYRVWIAEVMLQQTRIAAVLPYYQRFLARFPSVQSLAAAREHDVLKFWSGLGYYTRARHLHRAAREIVARHAGEFPRDRASALALPGIGCYTAAAVLSIAYDAPYAVLDGNVARVLARLGAMRGDLREPRRWKALGDAAQLLLPAAAPGDWNQALMELGETICTPQLPRCPDCPAASLCSARRLGLTSQIPAARKKSAPVVVRIAAAVLLDPAGRTLLSKDPGSHDAVLFSRMWQFPAVEVAVVRQARAELAVHLRTTLGLEPAAIEELPAARHSVTFRSITLLPFLVRVPRLPHRARTRIVPLAGFGHLSRVPISSATRKIAAAAAAAESVASPAATISTPTARPGKPHLRSRR